MYNKFNHKIKVLNSKLMKYGLAMSILCMLLLFCLSTNLLGQTIVQGEMLVHTNTQMFVVGDMFFQTNKVKIKLDGDILLTGDFVNNISAGNVFNGGTGIIEFTGNKKQSIKGTAFRDTNYIAFPNITIDKDVSYVEVETKMGADVGQLKLISGKLVLKSNKETNTSFYNDYSSDVGAHLRVKTGVQYNRSDMKQKGVVEVERQLSDAPDRKNKLFGFASPYKELYSDYFFANYLTSPSDVGLWGNDNTSIKDPEYKMLAGVGYIGGQNILPENRYDLDPVWGNPVTLHNARAINKLVFNRYALDESNHPIAAVINKNDKYLIEELNTGDVTIQLRKGWQYLGNPFTCPLDMDLFITTTLSMTDAWKVARPSDHSVGVSPKFWIIAEGSGVLDNWTPDRFQINPTWLVHQKIGSTLERESSNLSAIAPQQMFAVYAHEDVDITIPASQRTHNLRKNVTNPVKDEILLEVGDQRSFDRLAVVFRTGASLAATDEYDVTKMIDSIASPGQIFTMSSEGYAMITNVVPSTTLSLEMGMIPTLKAQSLNLTAHRISSLDNVSLIWLEDRVTNGAWVNLKTTSGYTFTSTPTDRIDRFVIHINVVANSQTVPPQEIPSNLFASTNLPSISAIASSSTGPVGSLLTNKKFEVVADLICEGSDGVISIDPSLLDVNYEVFDAPKQGNAQGNTVGTGSKITINTGTINQSATYYISALSNNLVTVNRRRPVTMALMKSMIYPDIRVAICPKTAQNIKLSKYLDTTFFKSVTWEKLFGASTLVGDELQILAMDSGVQTFKYIVTDVCKTASPAKLYLFNNKTNYKVVDTVVVCYETAEALQLNQIFGIEAGIIVVPSASLAPYVHLSVPPQLFAGATTFSGTKAYLVDGLLPSAPTKYGAGAKMAQFKYIPTAGSCFTQSELVIILTSTVM